MKHGYDLSFIMWSHMHVISSHQDPINMRSVRKRVVPHVHAVCPEAVYPKSKQNTCIHGDPGCHFAQGQKGQANTLGLKLGMGVDNDTRCQV
mmetsp:Transcript_27754/g.50083  ORF Transcript_27754/g.50083 Transcript_27754/m.50083 type:complete len:92 (+) Transcript_27754:434-709(+)